MKLNIQMFPAHLPQYRPIINSHYSSFGLPPSNDPLDFLTQSISGLCDLECSSHWTLAKIPSGGYFADIGNISRISAFETILQDFSGMQNFHVTYIQASSRDTRWHRTARCLSLTYHTVSSALVTA